jgi:type II secretory ATPase GspE/PulE/Tfp pilus assembly ATPase PilB-like protein
MDMGIEPFLISASLECVLAQRLIRKICTACRTAYEPSEQVLASLGLSIHDIGDKNFYYGKGCEALQPDRLQRPKRNLRTSQNLRPHPGDDQ